MALVFEIAVGVCIGLGLFTFVKFVFQCAEYDAMHERISYPREPSIWRQTAQAFMIGYKGGSK